MFVSLISIFQVKKGRMKIKTLLVCSGMLLIYDDNHHYLVFLHVHSTIKNYLVRIHGLDLNRTEPLTRLLTGYDAV